MPDKPYTLPAFIADLRRAVAEERMSRAAGPAASLVLRVATDRAWMTDALFTTDPDQGFGSHLLHEEPDHSLFISAAELAAGTRHATAQSRDLVHCRRRRRHGAKHVLDPARRLRPTRLRALAARRR